MACRFMVSPLTDDCGIIEWVRHTCSLRSVLDELYKAAGLDPKAWALKVQAMYDRHAQV